MKSDEVRRRLPGEVTVKLSKRHHIRAEFATFGDREHDDPDLAILQRVLAPNVTAIDEPLHRPLGELVGITNPLRSDPEETFVASEFCERCCHILSSLPPRRRDAELRNKKNAENQVFSASL